jgi:membrane protein
MAELTDSHGRADESSNSVGDLVRQLSEQTTTLIRQELRLATAEMHEKGRQAGSGAGMIGGAGLVGLYGVGALVAAAIIGLGTLVEPWLAAAIVGVVLLAAAGFAGLLGKQRVERAIPPTPEQAVESVQRDISTVKERARR